MTWNKGLVKALALTLIALLGALLTLGPTYPLEITQFAVSVEPSVLAAGGIDGISMKIKNLGEAVLEMDAVLSLPPQLVLLGDNRWRIGSLDKGKEVELKADLYVPLSSSGMAVSGTLTINYRRYREFVNGLPPISEPHSFGFLIKGRPRVSQLSVEVYPSTITAGSNNSVVVTITNRAESIYDVDVSITLSPPLIILGQNRISADELGEGEALRIELTVFAPDASAGQAITGSVAARFRLAGELVGGPPQGSEVHSFGLIVYGKLSLVMFKLLAFPEVVEAGSSFTVTGTILNKGNAPARHVNVSLSSEGPFLFGPESVSFLGNIPPNADASFSLSASSLADAEGSHRIRVLAVYEDDRHQERTLEGWVRIEIVRRTAAVGPKPPTAFEAFIGFISTPVASLAMLGAIAALAIALALQRLYFARTIRRLRQVG